MAINFLNTVDLNFNQLNKAALQNLAADPAIGVLGQIYYNTASSVLKICITASTAAPSDAVWASVSGDLTGLTQGTYINIDNPDGPIPTINHDDTTRTNTATSSSPNYGGDIVAIKAIGTNTTGHVTSVDTETYTLPADTNETYTLPVTVGAANSAKIELTAGGTGSGVKSTVEFVGTTSRIAITENTGNNGDITIDFPDDVSIVDDLTVGGIIIQQQDSTGDPAEKNTFAAVLDMSSNKIERVATGTVGTDAVNLNQVELLVAGIGVFQGGYDATNDPGTPNISGGSNVKLDLGDYFVVSHDGNITFSGASTTGVNNGALANSTALALTAANAAIVVGMDVTGTGVPSGVTIATVTNSSNFVLNSAITITNTVTLTFSDRVVKVEVGDFIFAKVAIAAGSDPAKTEYVIVQSDANIAGAGATDGATEKGVAGFDSASFDVSASGWVQLNSQRNPYGAKVSLNNTSPVSRATTGTPIDQTTFTVNIDDASIFGPGALAANVKVEVLDKASPQATVYPLVERSGSGSLTVKFSGDVAINIYQVLLSHV